ncbi:MAG: hypothetical protein IKH94_07480, partial [Eubacterium sp.]|nr:hypothetical protein [Eubacterium sp.]
NGNNKYKKSTIDTMANLFTLGIEGLFNYYANNGGLSTGRLGGVSSIRLDYKTDITVQLRRILTKRFILSSLSEAPMFRIRMSGR